MYRCPVCHHSLNAVSTGYDCVNKHHFDVSKDGRLHLLATHHHKERGDNHELIHARHRFLSKGHYQPIQDALIQSLGGFNFNTLVDCGCGEGYYTNAIARQFPNTNLIGIDLSKEGLKLASKARSQVQFVTASIADLPLMDKSMDGLISLFTPVYEQEFARVIKPNGFLWVGQPNVNHLLQLKQALYPKVILNTPKTLSEAFIHIKSIRVSFTLHLNQDDISDLLEMTPYAYTSSPTALDQVKSLQNLTIDGDVLLDVYQKRDLDLVP